MANELTDKYGEATRPYIDLIDELRSSGIEKDISIPQIVVMGDQSSGKSSVLESLCGVGFPRGAGLVTRCPTEIRMKKTPPGSDWKGKVSLRWERLYQPDDTGELSTRDDIGNAITELTKHLIRESGSEFSTDSIVIDIMSSDVPNLTVVDLPGIIHTVMDNQDRTVIAAVNSLIEKYLNQPRTIILAVIPANADLAVAGILEKAYEVDKDGDRTLGVFTKPDLVDGGTEGEVVGALTGGRKHLKHGYHMLRNRNNKELTDGVSLEEAHTIEMEFFRKHPVYSKLPEEYFGIAHLTEKLTNLLVSVIQSELPDMQKEMENMYKTTAGELSMMGEAPPQTWEQKSIEYARVYQRYVHVCENATRGQYADPLFSNESYRLLARIRELLDTLYEDIQETKPNFDDEEFVEDLKGVIVACRGRELPGFLSFYSFARIMGGYIDRWRLPSLACLDDIHDIFEEVHLSLISVTIQQCYVKLVEDVKNAVLECINEVFEVTKKQINEAIDREMSELYTQNHYFMDSVKQYRYQMFVDGLTSHLESLPAPQPDSVTLAKDITTWYMDGIGNMSNLDQEAVDMCIFLKSYWKVCMKCYADNIPKIIQENLQRCVKKLHEKLASVNTTSVETYFDVTLSEKAARKYLVDRKERLEGGLKKLKVLGRAKMS